MASVDTHASAAAAAAPAAPSASSPVASEGLIAPPNESSSAVFHSLVSSTPQQRRHELESKVRTLAFQCCQVPYYLFGSPYLPTDRILRAKEVYYARGVKDEKDHDLSPVLCLDIDWDKEEDPVDRRYVSLVSVGALLDAGMAEELKPQLEEEQKKTEGKDKDKIKLLKSGIIIANKLRKQLEGHMDESPAFLAMYKWAKRTMEMAEKRQDMDEEDVVIDAIDTALRVAGNDARAIWNTNVKDYVNDVGAWLEPDSIILKLVRFAQDGCTTFKPEEQERDPDPNHGSGAWVKIDFDWTIHALKELTRWCEENKKGDEEKEKRNKEEQERLEAEKQGKEKLEEKEKQQVEPIKKEDEGKEEKNVEPIKEKEKTEETPDTTDDTAIDAESKIKLEEAAAKKREELKALTPEEKKNLMKKEIFLPWVHPRVDLLVAKTMLGIRHVSKTYLKECDKTGYYPVELDHFKTKCILEASHTNDGDFPTIVLTVKFPSDPQVRLGRADSTEDTTVPANEAAQVWLHLLHAPLRAALLLLFKGYGQRLTDELGGERLRSDPDVDRLFPRHVRKGLVLDSKDMRRFSAKTVLELAILPVTNAREVCLVMRFAPLYLYEEDNPTVCDFILKQGDQTAWDVYHATRTEHASPDSGTTPAAAKEDQARAYQAAMERDDAGRSEAELQQMARDKQAILAHSVTTALPSVEEEHTVEEKKEDKGSA